MAYKMLNSIFYKDLADIIVSYNMIDPVDVDCNQITMVGEFMIKWDFAARHEEDYGDEREMNYKIFFELFDNYFSLPSFKF